MTTQTQQSWLHIFKAPFVWWQRQPDISEKAEDVVYSVLLLNLSVAQNGIEQLYVQHNVGYF